MSTISNTTALNAHYKLAAIDTRTLEKKGTSMYQHLSSFAAPLDAVTIKQAFKAQETAASLELKVSMSANSTYRVCKSVICKAVELGIDLLDSKGKPRSKHDVEDEIKAATAKDPKTAYEVFMTHMVQAGKKVDSLSAQERLTAASVCNDLLKVVTSKLNLKAAA